MSTFQFVNQTIFARVWSVSGVRWCLYEVEMFCEDAFWRLDWQSRGRGIFHVSLKTVESHVSWKLFSKLFWKIFQKEAFQFYVSGDSRLMHHRYFMWDSQKRKTVSRILLKKLLFYFSGHSFILWANPATRTQACDAQPLVRTLHQGRSHGSFINPKIQTGVINSKEIIQQTLNSMSKHGLRVYQTSKYQHAKISIIVKA